MSIKQCWAFNGKGQRCEQGAGHDGDHTISITWNDDECASPATVTVQSPSVVTTSVTSGEITVTTPEATSCVACGHRHRSGECKCGCKEFIG